MNRILTGLAVGYRDPGTWLSVTQTSSLAGRAYHVLKV